MKKSLLFLGLSAAMAFTAAADNVISPSLTRGTMMFDGVKITETLPNVRHAAATDLSRANATSMLYSPSGNPTGACLSNCPQGSVIGEAIEFTSAITTAFAGNEIKEIVFWNGYDQSTRKNTITKVTLFIADKLTNTPVYTQEMVASTTAYGMNRIALTTPYQIEAGKQFFFGIKFTVNSTNDVIVICDGNAGTSDDTGGWIGMAESSTANLTWSNYADKIGSVSIFAVIEGDKLPQNRGKLEWVDTKYLSAVYNNPMEIYVSVLNDGANEIENFDVEFTVGNGEKVTKTITCPTPLAYAEGATYSVEGGVPTELGNGIPVNMKLTKINGVENGVENQTASTTFLSVPSTWDVKRKVVVEEATGQWCGWCPRGIVFMERVRKNYADGTVVPIAVHQANGASAPDAMNCSAYSSFVSEYAGGFPAAIANRMVDVDLDPDNFDDFDYIHKLVTGSAAVADLGLEAELEKINAFSTRLSVKTTTTFGIDVDQNDAYRLSFVVTEDNVGPYDQTNYYAPAYGQNMKCDGWEKLGAKVSTIYNDVARTISTYAGVANSVPAKITAGEANVFDYQFNMPSSVTNVDNAFVIALLLNKNTGVIENAVSIPGSKIVSSVNDAVVKTATVVVREGAIEVTGATETSVYTTSGVCVASVKGDATIALPAGLYIVKADAEAQKVVVK